MTNGNSPTFNRRTMLKAMGAAGALAGAGTMLSVVPGQAADEFTVRMQLGWLASIILD